MNFFPGKKAVIYAIALMKKTATKNEKPLLKTTTKEVIEETSL